MGVVRVGWLLVIAAFLFLPLAQASTTAPWNAMAPHGMNNGFGWVGMDYRVVYRGEDIELRVPILVRADPIVDNATYMMFSFNLHSDAVEIDFVSLTANGTELLIDRDEREASKKSPKVILAGKDVPRDMPLEMTGLVRANRLGEHHVGVLVIAFDNDWSVMRTTSDTPAQLYGFTMLRSAVPPAGRFSAPIQGIGNDWSALLLPVVLSGGVFVIGLSAVVARLLLIRRSPRPAPTRTT